MSKIRGKKELIHPIFLECKEKVENSFWKSLFEEFAYGKYPKQLYVNQQQQIQSTNRNNFFQYSFKDKTIDEMIPEIQELLLTHTSLISNEEIIQKKNDHIKFKEEKITSWKDIKKKFIKEMFLMDYCIQLKQDHKLSTYTIYNLYTLLRYSNVSDVQIENNKIIHIPGIFYDAKSNTFSMMRETDDKVDSTIECPDMVTHYCKRYLIRLAKSKEKEEK